MTGEFSIRTRLTLIYSFLLSMALLLSGVAVVTLMRYRLTTRLDASLDHRLEGVERFLIRETTAATAHMIPLELEEYASTQPEGHWIEVRDESGRLLLRGEQVSSPARTRERTFDIYGHRYQTRAAASLAPIQESVQEIGLLLLSTAPLLLIVIGLTGYWISSRALQPVDEMTRAARNLSVSNLSQRLPVPSSGDELSRLAEAWNEMLSRLQESISRMRRFTADAAHELRTPLTALRTTAELSLRRERDPQEYREALEQLVAISERMTHLTEGLLALARGDDPPAPRMIGRVDLPSLVRGVVAEMDPLFNERNLTVQVALAAGPVWLEADADGLRRLVAALLDNARKYTPAGGVITISLKQDGAWFELEVTDNGCGIPAESLTRIFDRFYCVDASRDRQTGGYGLGLAIAQQIAQAHHGDLEASSVPGAGTTFRLRLPDVLRSEAQPARR